MRSSITYTLFNTIIQILYWIINLLMRFAVMTSLQYYHCLPTLFNVFLQLCFEVTLPIILCPGTWDRETWRTDVKPRIIKYYLNLRMLNFRNSEPDFFFFHLFKLQLAILSAAVNVQPFSNLGPDVSNWATRKWKMTEAGIASISLGQHSIACSPLPHFLHIL